MPDPFDALLAPVAPVDPTPAFRARLRQQLERAIHLPKGVAVSTIDLDDRADDVTKPGDIVYSSLWVPDVRRAAAFYAAALGWEYEPDEYPQGRTIAGSTPHQGLWEEPDPSKHTLMVCYAVEDVGAAVERVRAAGGTAEEPSDEPYGVVASCVDDHGLPFAVWHAHRDAPAEPRGPANGHRQGDLAYVTLEVSDSGRARAFYGAVLGWRFVAGPSEDGWGPEEEPVPMFGLQGGHERTAAIPMWRVDDVVATVERVRTAGGTATDAAQQPYGLTADCVDDQGMRFWVWQP